MTSSDKTHDQDRAVLAGAPLDAALSRRHVLHHRLVGAEAVIRRLLAGQAIGLVTTHDLELTRVVDHLAPATANIHFAEEVVAGELRCDYRIRPGVVQSSNALTLMRNMGLDV